MMRHKPYRDLQSLPVSTHRWKDLSIDFVTKLPISTNWKDDSYDSIFVIVDWLMNIVYYKLIKITIHTPDLVKVIMDMVVQHQSLFNSIVSDWSLVFSSKFLLSLCYFLEIKQELSTTFHLQINGQIKRPNNTIEAYLRAFINYK